MNVTSVEGKIKPLESTQVVIASNKWIAEFLGAFAIVFAGTGAIIVNQLTNSLTHVGVAITFGLVVMSLIYSFGHISGAHFNPAVTISFLLLKRISYKEAAGFIGFQILGALMASMILYLMFGNIANLGATLPSGTWLQSAILEFIMTFFLMLIILSSSVHSKASKPFAGIAIGGTVALEALFGGPISGASMNPARSIGPAVISGNLEYIWLYIIFTTLGACLAAVVYRLIHE